MHLGIWKIIWIRNLKCKDGNSFKKEKKWKRNNALKEMEEKDKVVLEIMTKLQSTQGKNVCELKH